MDLRKFDNAGFDRGAPRWKEALWLIVRSVFFAGWFPLPSAVRVFWLRMFGARIGRGVVIRGRVNITFPWRFECGDHVWIGEEVVILSLANVRIEGSVCISQQAFLCTGSHDFSKEAFDLVSRPIDISDGAWLGARTFIGPGVRLGKNCRCLAGAVVVKSVAAKTTVGGVPARITSG
jgi:putative colanic acid biosynthesis acetyltransferase WcaF